MIYANDLSPSFTQSLNSHLHFCFTCELFIFCRLGCDKMALESLAALSVASNIVQFIEFSCRIFSESLELYKSSEALVAENIELEAISSSLTRLSDDLLLTPYNNQLSPDDSDLLVLANSCKRIAA